MPRHGYLVLADIAGYTAFLTGSELEHASGIVDELISVIRDALAPPLRLVKLEGDCVFCCADDTLFGSPERVIELVEACYVAFGDRLFDMQRATTCTCRACASIGTLDLKFVVHHGEWVDAGGELTGADVILAHRLLKNDVTERTGVRAYALFTEAFCGCMPAQLALPQHIEEVERFGAVEARVHDLAPVARAMREARRVYVSADEADCAFSAEVGAPAAVVWDAWFDAKKRLSWESRLTGLDHAPNQAGRTGLGSTTHCAHGGALSLHRYLDWRPFRYWTEESDPVRGLFSPPPMRATVELEPLAGGGTRVSVRLELRRGGRLGAVRARLAAPVVRRMTAPLAGAIKRVAEDAWAAQEGAIAPGQAPAAESDERTAAPAPGAAP